MNKSNIDWCDITINPIVGCKHGCFYCYAREMVEHGRLKELYNGSFEPSFFPERVNEIANYKGKGKKIFVCSMSDMFGEWVPNEWIEQILKACAGNKDNTFLFLTKNPARYEEFTDLFTNNMLIGMSTEGANNREEAEKIFSFYEIDTGNAKKFISLEPFYKEAFDGLYELDWVIVGGMTGKYASSHKIIEAKYHDVLDQCVDNGVPVFVKDNAKIPKAPKMYWYDKY